MVVFGIWTAIGLLFFAYYYLDVFARGRTEPFHIKFVEELTGAWGTLPIAAVVYWLTPRLAGRGWRTIAAHAGVALVMSVFHTTWNWGTRSLAFAIFGFGPYDYGIIPLRYLMELPSDLIWYAVFATIAMLFNHYRAARDREVRLAELESEMAKVRLQALEARLHPHFLFNALNTVSSVMYEDVERADQILTRLADLLRRSLRHDPGSEVPLEEELATLELYLDVIRARFGDRLRVSVDADAGVRRVAVPPLVLQPLVENAIRHGDPGPEHEARVLVRARRDNGSLVMEVRDNGPGLRVPPDEALSSGIGLSTTKRRLERLYGTDAALTLETAREGGLCVRVSMPGREWSAPRR
jgi:sensor histidine kinase YesM